MAGFSFEEFERNGFTVNGSIKLKSLCLALKRNIVIYASRNMSVVMRERKTTGTRLTAGGIRAHVSKTLVQYSEDS